jgi:hypothetical protein
MEAHTEATESYPRVVEAYPTYSFWSVEAHPGAMDAPWSYRDYPRATETHSGATEVHLGATRAHPGTVEVYTGGLPWYDKG